MEGALLSKTQEIFMLRAKIDELDMMTHRIAMKFPRHERHVLAAEVRAIMGNIIRYEVRASQMQGSESRRQVRPAATLDILQRLDAEVGLLKRQIHKAANLDYLKSQGAKVQGEWSGLTAEVGKLLGAWLKTVEARVYPFQEKNKAPAQQGLLE